MPHQVDYDAIAQRYDENPHRTRDVDDALLAFVEERKKGNAARILDVGCGTGNQLAANLTRVDASCMVGLDRSGGMLQRARGKSPAIPWVRGDAAWLPFRDGSFDFVTSQFSFHHVQGKASMLAEVHRVLRRGGRFVLTNITPWGMKGSWIYRYFPAAWELDIRRYLPEADVEKLMAQAGFTSIDVETRHEPHEKRLADFLDIVRERAISHFAAISEEAYAAGVQRMEAELDADSGRCVASEVCFIKIVADKLAKR